MIVPCITIAEMSLGSSTANPAAWTCSLEVEPASVSLFNVCFLACILSGLATTMVALFYHVRKVICLMS